MTDSEYEYVRSLKPNDYFGEIALLNASGHRTAQVSSLNYSILLSLPSRVFLSLCNHYPSFKKFFKCRMKSNYDDKMLLFLTACLR